MEPRPLLLALVYDDPGFTTDDLRRLVDEAGRQLADPPTSVASHDGWFSVAWEEPSFVLELRWSTDDGVRSIVQRALAHEGVAVDPTRRASRALVGTTTGRLEAPDLVNFLIALTTMLSDHPALATTLAGPAGP